MDLLTATSVSEKEPEKNPKKKEKFLKDEDFGFSLISSSNEEILYSGFMTKLGSKFKTWKKRFFRLFHNGTMSYYKNDLPSTKPLNEKPIVVFQKKIGYAKEKRLKSKYCIKIQKNNDDYFFFYSQSSIVMFEWFCRLIEAGGILNIPNLNGFLVEHYNDDQLHALGITSPENREKVFKRIYSLDEFKENVLFSKMENLIGGIVKSKKKFHFSNLIRSLSSVKLLQETYLSTKDISQHLLSKHLLMFDEKVKVQPYENKFILVKILLSERFKRKTKREILDPTACDIPPLPTKMEKVFSSIIVGQWLLEWNENSIVVPKRIYGDKTVKGNKFGLFVDSCARTLCILDLEVKGCSLESVASVLSYVVAKWNTKMTYNEKPDRSSNEGNCQDFVDDVIRYMGVKEKDCKDYGKVSGVLNQIRKKGYLNFEVQLSEIFQEFLGKKNRILKIQKHKDIDDLFNGLSKMQMITFQNEFKRYYYTLKCLDSTFWLRGSMEGNEDNEDYKENNCILVNPLDPAPREYNARYFKGYVEYSMHEKRKKRKRKKKIKSEE